MPQRESPSCQNWWSSNSIQPQAARYALSIVGCYPWFAVLVELYAAKGYSLQMLRVAFFYPLVSTVAGVIATVAYCQRISWGYIIAGAINGISMVGWMVELGWLIISWSISSGFFARLEGFHFYLTVYLFLSYTCLTLVFEAALLGAYLDSKKEARSSNAVDPPRVPETSKNLGSVENGHSSQV